MRDLTLNKFQGRAAKTGKNYVKVFSHDPAIALALRIGEEAGEVQGIMKRLAVGDLYEGKKNLDLSLLDEMSDLLHALSQLATYMDIELQEVAEHAINKQSKKGSGIVG